MKKYFFTFLVALIVGFLLSNIFLVQYNDYNGIKVSSSLDDIYFIQYGVFSSQQSMEENTIELENYVYNISEDMYYVYIGITNDENNVNKIVNYYKNLGYETIVKKYGISNEKFIDELKNFDTILSDLDDNVAIASIINQTLRKYEEVVISGG